MSATLRTFGGTAAMCKIEPDIMAGRQAGCPLLGYVGNNEGSLGAQHSAMWHTASPCQFV